MGSGVRIVVLAIAVALAGACAAPGTAAVPAARPTIEVALVDVFSGPTGETGRQMRNGLELAAGDINARGGLLGQQIEIVSADGELTPSKAAELVRQQVGDPSVGLVVGPDHTASFQAARSALDASGVSSCLVRVSDEALSSARSTFRVAPANSAEVAVLLDAVHRAHADVHKIGLLDEGDDLGRSYDSQLAAQSGGAGLNYVGRVSAGPTGDQRGALLQLAGQGAQVVVLSQQPAGAVRVAQAASQLGSGRPLLAGFGTLADYAFAGRGGEAATGAILATTPQAYLTSAPQAQWPPAYRAFVGESARLYGVGVEGMQLQATPAAADCLLQWSRAVQAAGTFRGAQVARAWESLDLSASETALGVRERLTTGDHNSVAQDQLVAYTWTKAGSRSLLVQVPTG